MIDVRQFATNLVPGEDGVWFTGRNSEVSYPKEGNVRCASIEEESFWFAHRNRCILEALRRFPPRGVLFDVGGGNGFVSLAIQNSGHDVVIVEPGVQGAAAARSRGIQQVICGAFQDVEFLPNSVAAVGMFDVLEHIEDDIGFLESLKRSMIPGGMLYLTVPAYQVLWSAEDERGGHFRRYTTRSLAAVLKAAGFEPEFTSYFFTFLPVPIFFRRTLLSKLGRRKASDPGKGAAEHKPRKGVLGSVLQCVFGIESRMLRRGPRIPFGGSCLAVARSPDSNQLGQISDGSSAHSGATH